MKVCVFGLWHLGTVTAACLADAGHDVVGLDTNQSTIDQLNQGHPPIFEPGLTEMLQKNIAAQRLQFTVQSDEALIGADVLWVTFDTPVDENDRADVDMVMQNVEALFPHISSNTLVLISSQVVVGTTGQLETHFQEKYTGKHVSFAYSPENLRLGKAIEVFTQPDRVVMGVRDQNARQKVETLMSPITDRIEWMGVESAEMTKHALNAFLATSITFINEIAALCERVGADAKEVERGLKSEARIGPRAYLGPGGAYSGGTLARDIAFLQAIGHDVNVPVHLIESVEASNNAHKTWAYRRLQSLLGTLTAKRIAILGLTYKPGTDTLRRSSALELCQKLSEAGATVVAFDPKVTTLPDHLRDVITLADNAVDALQNADAVVIATEWPDFKALEADQLLSHMAHPIVLDANRFLNNTLGNVDEIQYFMVGKS